MVQIPYVPAFSVSSIPEQKKLSNLWAFPAVLEPTMSKTNQTLIEALKHSSELVHKLLQQSGAVLIRGFDLDTAEDFNEVMESTGWEEFPYSVGGEATRRRVVGKVFTANDGIPLNKSIGFHNEVAYLSNCPSKIIFFCQTPPPPDAGGSTFIAHGRTVYERMCERGHQNFLEELDAKGVRYFKLLAGDGNGSWRSMFQTENKLEAEKRAQKVGSRLEWLPDGRAQFISSPCPGTKISPANGEKVWFNTIAGIQVFKANTPPGTFDAFFGDGKAFPEDALEACLGILDEEKVAFPWQKGDVLILDNTSVLHARQPSKSPRTILVSLCK